MIKDDRLLIESYHILMEQVPEKYVKQSCSNTVNMNEQF